jgi:hypothetical protein
VLLYFAAGGEGGGDEVPSHAGCGDGRQSDIFGSVRMKGVELSGEAVEVMDRVLTVE